MANPPLEISYDKGRNLIRLDLAGFMSVPMVEACEIEIIRALQGMTTTGSVKPLMLIDATRHGVQSQEVIARVSQTVAKVELLTSRIAVVTAGALHKMQSDRVSRKATHRAFVTEDDALQWLLGD